MLITLYLLRCLLHAIDHRFNRNPKVLQEQIVVYPTNKVDVFDELFLGFPDDLWMIFDCDGLYHSIFDLNSLWLPKVSLVP